MIILDNANRCLFTAVTEGIIYEDFGYLIRVYTLGNAQYGAALQIVDVGNGRAIAATSLGDLLRHLRWLSRTIDHMLIVGRHGASNIVD